MESRENASRRWRKVWYRKSYPIAGQESVASVNGQETIKYIIGVLAITFPCRPPPANIVAALERWCEHLQKQELVVLDTGESRCHHPWYGWEYVHTTKSQRIFVWLQWASYHGLTSEGRISLWAPKVWRDDGSYLWNCISVPKLGCRSTLLCTMRCRTSRDK